MAEDEGREGLPVHVSGVSPRELTGTTLLKRGDTAGGREAGVGGSGAEQASM